MVLNSNETSLFSQTTKRRSEGSLPLLQAQGSGWVCDLHPAREQPKRKPSPLHHGEAGVCTLGQTVQHHLRSSHVVTGLLLGKSTGVAAPWVVCRYIVFLKVALKMLNFEITRPLTVVKWNNHFIYAICYVSHSEIWQLNKPVLWEISDIKTTLLCV